MGWNEVENTTNLFIKLSIGVKSIDIGWIIDFNGV